MRICVRFKLHFWYGIWRLALLYVLYGYIMCTKLVLSIKITEHESLNMTKGCKILRLLFVLKVTVPQVGFMCNTSWVFGTQLCIWKYFLVFVCLTWSYVYDYRILAVLISILVVIGMHTCISESHIHAFANLRFVELKCLFNLCSFWIRQSTWKELRCTSQSLKLMPLMLNLLETKFPKTSCKSMGVALFYRIGIMLPCLVAAYWPTYHRI